MFVSSIACHFPPAFGAWSGVPFGKLKEIEIIALYGDLLMGYPIILTELEVNICYVNNNRILIFR